MEKDIEIMESMMGDILRDLNREAKTNRLLRSEIDSLSLRGKRNNSIKFVLASLVNDISSVRSARLVVGRQVVVVIVKFKWWSLFTWRQELCRVESDLSHWLLPKDSLVVVRASE